MNNNGNHYDMHHTEPQYSGERQYDAYMFAEYGIEH
ncbi:hypothetical protein BBIA_1069 [Bifidobacterium biavatii DSM 23969]|uniref:Uncharacterized protein n=1 Tax=Bifidobacterium biavatii DSM 23969 TaxID=1437608 RepID=A0A087A2U3_9BIFI|nr:hypothetical protein BBIA_1069 [Bifidobacterium biavatii DSM 23969]